MKNLLLILTFITISVYANAQAYKYKYYLDENLVSVPAKSALIIGKGLKDSIGFRLDCFNNSTGAIIFSGYTTDSTISFLNGPYKSYYANGRIEYDGSYLNGFEDKLWLKRDSSGNLIDSSFYEGGKKITTATFYYGKDNMLYEVEFADSLKNTFRNIDYNDKGGIKYDAQFIGEDGVLLTYDSLGVATKSILKTKERIKAQMEGGTSAFSDYLRRNLDAAVPAIKGASSGTYTVILKFTVEIDGTISNIIPETNLGFGMEKEAIRVIKNSPKWKPASNYGTLVKAYRRQPITFVVDNGR